MTGLRRGGTAKVITLDPKRGVGAAKVVYKSNGRRLGDHGNRVPHLLKVAAMRELTDLLEANGQVTCDQKAHVAETVGVELRTIDRWLRDHADALLDHHDDDESPAQRSMPTWLYRYEQTEKLRLTPKEVAYIASFATAKQAFDAIHADPDHRLHTFATSTLYGAWNDISSAVRAGAKANEKKQRALEGTYPLTGRDVLNETWSVDEYDLKVTASLRGVTVNPKVLIVRERHSGLLRSIVIRPHAMTGADTGVALAAATLGFTVTHPYAGTPGYDDDAVLRIDGVARRLICDQAGTFIHGAGADAARRLGIPPTPPASHTPQANGDHEVMHQSLLRHLVAGAGSRRTWTDRAGTPLDHGVLPYDVVVELVEEWFATYNSIEPISGHNAGAYKGLTRLEAYALAHDSGNTYDGHDITDADAAALAVPVAEATMDATRGVHYAGQYWASPQLYTSAKKGQTITLAQLNDPETLYAFTKRGQFIGVVTPRADADVDDVTTHHKNRARRQEFVTREVAVRRAANALADADAYWAATADGLADVLADADPADSADPAEVARITDDAVDAPAPTRTVGKPVRPARRGRRPAPDPHGPDVDHGDQDAAADALAALYDSVDPTPADGQQGRDGDGGTC